MNDLTVIVLPTWAFWFLVVIGVLNTIDMTLKIVNHFLAKRLAKRANKTCSLGKCWKCGDSDPALTDLCTSPSCGMREGGT